MKVFVAGSTGALGTPVVEMLVSRGHEVFGLTRSSDKAAMLRAAGAEPVIADVLDARKIEEVIGSIRPEAVLQLLNALPKRGPMRPKEIESTNELRVTGTKNLLGAATETGVRRYVAESMIFGYGYGNNEDVKTEDDPFPVPASSKEMAPALDALGYLEKSVLDAAERNEIEGIALRFGIFYGPGVGSTEFAVKLLRRRMMLLPGGGKGVISWIHIEDAASATVAALESDISGEVFNVVDDRPASFAEHFGGIAEARGLRPPGRLPEFLARLGGSYTAQMSRTNLNVSNEKIKDSLGWAPRFPSFEEGARTLASA